MKTSYKVTAAAAHSDLMAVLDGRGIKPSPKHSQALYSLLEALSANFHGRLAGTRQAALCSLSPGQAKTTALQCFIRHVSKHPEYRTETGLKYSQVGILVCINTLDEIEAFAQEIDRKNLCVWVGHDGDQEGRCAELGDIKNPPDAQIVVTTHKRIEMELSEAHGTKDFWAVSSLKYKRGFRLCRVWDEAYLAGSPVVLPLRDLKRAQPYLDEHNHLAGDDLSRIIKIAQNLLEDGQQVTAWTMADFWRSNDLDHDALMRDLASDRGISNQQLEMLSDIFKALAYISGKKVVVRADGNTTSSTLLTYTPTIPDSFLPVVILDASGAPGIRRTYDEMVKNGTLTRLEPSVPKSYKNFKIDVWRKGGGKSQFISNFGHRVAGICHWLATEVPSGERVLVIHHKPDTPEQVEAKERKRKRKQRFRPVMPNIQEAIAEFMQENYPAFDLTRIEYTTWGKHRAQNCWKDFENVVAAGTLFKPDSVYEATLRIARSFKPEHGHVASDSLEDFKLGEYADDLLQGLGRIRIRQPHNKNSEVAPPARALVVAHPSSGIPDHLADWFPGAKVRSVVLVSGDLDGPAAQALAFLEDWCKRSSFGATLTFRTLKQSLGMSNADFRDKCQGNKAFNDRLTQLGIVKYHKDPRSKYAQGYQLTANVENTQEQLLDERESVAAIYGFDTQ